MSEIKLKQNKKKKEQQIPVYRIDTDVVKNLKIEFIVDRGAFIVSSPFSKIAMKQRTNI